MTVPTAEEEAFGDLFCEMITEQVGAELRDPTKRARALAAVSLLNMMKRESPVLLKHILGWAYFNFTVSEQKESDR